MYKAKATALNFICIRSNYSKMHSYTHDLNGPLCDLLSKCLQNKSNPSTMKGCSQIVWFSPI